MSRINNKNVKIGDSYVLPITNSTITKYEAKVESLLNDVELEKQQVLAQAEQEAENIKTRANLVVQEAENKAQEIINNAKDEAANIIKQAEADQETIKADTENISKQAYEEGFNKGKDDGFAQFKQDAHDALISLDTLADSSFEMKQNIIKSADMDIIELVIAIARKITSRAFDEEMLKEITSNAISALPNKEQITLIVNPKLVENITKISEEFKQEITQLNNIKIIEDSSLSSDGTIIETSATRIDSRVSSQIDEIAAKLMNGITDDVQQE